MNFTTAKDKIHLACYMDTPSGQPSAAILVLHGMGDHAQALPYRLLTEYLLSKNFLVIRCDLRGHGRSGGERMYVKDMDVFTDDIMQALEDSPEHAGGLPIFVIGLSMGGLLGLRLAQQYPGKIKGVVAVSPALDPSGSPAVIRALVPLFAWLMPKKRVDIKLDLSFISRDKQATEEYINDEHWQTKTTLKFGAAVLKAMKQVHSSAPSFPVPLFLLQGSHDRIVPPEGGQVFFNKAGSLNKRLHVFDGAYHNLFLDTNRAEVFDFIGGWIAKNTDKGK